VFNASVHDNIAFGRSSARRDEIAAARAPRGHPRDDHETARRVRLRGGRAGAHAVGRRKQRLTIARAILRDSPILILDGAHLGARLGDRGPHHAGPSSA